MAVALFTTNEFVALDENVDNVPNAYVYFYEPGTTTLKSAYADVDLQTALANPIQCDGNGKLVAFLNGQYRIKVFKQDNSTLIRDTDGINKAPSAITSNYNLATNGSFETDTTGDGTPDNVELTPYTNGVIAQDTADGSHGGACLKFTDGGGGGGFAMGADFFEVSVNRNVEVLFELKSSAVDVRNLFELVWYNSSQVELSTGTAYDEAAANPTSWAPKAKSVTPPATAVYAKWRFYGCHSSAASSGKITRLDNVVIRHENLDGLLATKGDIPYASAANVPAVLALGTPGQVITPVGGVPVWAAPADGPHTLNNVSISSSVAANDLTIALKTKDGGDATSIDIAKIAFPSETLLDGDYDTISITAALSIVVEDGETLGIANSTTGLIYVYAINNAGTVELAVRQTAYRDRTGRVSTTALSAGADSDNVMYSTTARTNVGYRLLGTLKILHGAGVWDAAATEERQWFPGMPQTGDVVQTVYAQSSTAGTGTTAIPNDNTIPQSGEGNACPAATDITITPEDAVNTLIVEGEGYVDSATGAPVILVFALFQDATASALSSSLQDATNVLPVYVRNKHIMVAGTASSTTFKWRYGTDTTDASYWMDVAGAARMGGSWKATMKVTEIQA